MTAAGFPTLVGGNIGTPAISLAERAKPETVDRARNFQLSTGNHSDLPPEDCRRPECHARSSRSPPHLRGLRRRQGAHLREPAGNDFAVLNADDPTCVAMAARTRAQVFWFSRQKEVEQGAWVRDGNIVFPRRQRAARDPAGLRDPAQRRAQSGKRSGRGLCRRADGLRAGENSPGRPRLQGRRAPAGICGHDPRRRLLQRFQSHERRRDHQGAGVLSRQISTSSSAARTKAATTPSSTICCASA